MLDDGPGVTPAGTLRPWTWLDLHMPVSRLGGPDAAGGMRFYFQRRRHQKDAESDDQSYTILAKTAMIAVRGNSACTRLMTVL